MSSRHEEALPPPTSPSRRKWFPPATFQLRLRSVKSILFKGCRDIPEGSFHLTLQSSIETEPFFTSSPASRKSQLDFVIWSDLDLTGPVGGLTGVIMKVWFTSKKDSEMIEPYMTAAVSFSNLLSLGVNVPCPFSLKDNSLVFQMSGSYFVTETSSHSPKKHLFIGNMNKMHVRKSTDAPMLAQFLRKHRAMVQQTRINDNLREELIFKGVDHTHEKVKNAKTKTRTLREEVFRFRGKETVTRMTECSLREKIEVMRVRVNLLREEKWKKKEELEEKLRRIHDLNSDMNDRTTILMSKYHSFSREKTHFVEWNKRYAVNRRFCQSHCDALKVSQLILISRFRELFPIQLTSPPTIRWVTLPTPMEARGNSRLEMDFSVVLGWISHLISIFSAIADLPLRYPITCYGSLSHIRDPSKGMSDCEFPLYTKNAGDLARTDYALFLLKKDLAQLRWFYGIVTHDLKNIHKNLDELMEVGWDLNHSALSPSRSEASLAHLSPPETSISKHLNDDEDDSILIESGEDAVISTSAHADILKLNQMYSDNVIHMVTSSKKEKCPKDLSSQAITS